MTGSIDRSRERAAAMRMYIEMFHAIRDVIFGKGLRREGDTTVELVAAAVALGHSEGRPMNASTLASSLELPRSTVREKLAVLVATGVIVRVGNKYYLEPGRAKSPS